MNITRELDPAVENTSVRPPKRTPVARWLGIALLVLVMLAYYFWAAIAAHGGAPAIRGEQSDHFNLLSRGFQKGNLYLDTEVPQEIVQAPNPYDPKLREKVSVLHDASYYRGKYYIYFGPAPVVTLLLPFSFITGHDLPLPYAVWFFSSAGFLALAGIFVFLQRRHYPHASLWTIAAGLIALGGASMIVALLRRGNFWETSAASGFFYFAASMVCLVRALHSSRSTRWATLGGLALGLAVASRPTYLMCSVLFALPLLFRRGQADGKRRYGWPALLGAAAACAIPVLALLAYNYARFGNPLEFGVTYQLTSAIESENRHFSLEYVGFNFRVYFLAALNWLPLFPFAHGVTLPPFPPGHGGHEYTFGMITNLPFTWFALVLFGALLWWRKKRVAGFWPAIAVLAAAGAINAALLLCFFGNCIRYMVDFTPWFMLLASVGLVEAEARLNAGFMRNTVRAAGLVLAIWSGVVAALSVVTLYDYGRSYPAAYRPVARALNFPVFWLQQQRWPGHQPVELSLSLPADGQPRREVLASVTRGDTTTALVLIEYLQADKFRLGYREPAAGRPAVFSPAITARRGAAHTLRLSIGGPYSDFDGTKGRLRAQFDHLESWDARCVSAGTYPGKLTFGRDAAPDPNTGAFTGQIHAQRPVIMTDVPLPPVSGVRVRITFTPEMIGRALPLLTTGETRAGDLLFVHVQRNGTMKFGYDHWGDTLHHSPEVPIAPGESRVIEFWVPALGGTEPGLLVKVDGATVWQREAPAYPFAPRNVFPGGNPIGGTTCEVALENAVFEDLQVPPPAP